MSVASSICAAYMKLALHFLLVQAVPVTASIEITVSPSCKPGLRTLFRIQLDELYIVFRNVSEKGDIMCLAHLMFYRNIIVSVGKLHLHRMPFVIPFCLHLWQQDTAAAVRTVTCGLYHIAAERAYVER